MQMRTSGGNLVQGKSGRKLLSDIAKGKAINSEQGEEFRHQKHRHVSCLDQSSRLSSVILYPAVTADWHQFPAWLNMTQRHRACHVYNTVHIYDD